MSKQSQVGKLGEEIAQKLLILKGFLIICRNFHIQGGEIDIICKKGRKLYFIEVKTRTNLNYGFAEESFNWRKRQRIKRAVFTYLSQQKGSKSWQVDLVVVELDVKIKTAKIRHFQNVEL
ncbi:MAG: YraN family protein [Patescibacteria group bacterium]|jgi:putative endonuclease